mgnify:CR=1 FL=1
MRVVIMGCGRVGILLTQELVAAGHQVAVIDRDARAFDRLPPGFEAKRVVGLGFDRGVLAPGYLADLNLIDLDRLACRPPRIVPDLPAGGRRLVQDAVGYRLTVKRGAVTFEDGEPTGARPGTLLRGSQPAPA